MWTLEHVGDVSDVVRGKAVSDEAIAWCGLYSLQKTVSYSIQRYEMERCAILALAYCHRLQFFYDIWQSQGENFYAFTESDIASYEEQVELKDLAKEVHGKFRDLEERIKQLRGFIPQLSASALLAKFHGSGGSASASSSSAPG